MNVTRNKIANYDGSLSESLINILITLAYDVTQETNIVDITKQVYTTGEAK